MREPGAERLESFFLNPGIQLEDFFLRWKKARLAAVRSGIAAAEGADQSDEETLLGQVPLDARDRVLRGAFDNSRKLGRGLARMQSLEAEPSDLAELLSRSTIRCFTGAWRRAADQSSSLERQGCEGAREPFICDFWREAIDGLASGAGSDLRAARHRCVGHGDNLCLDVFFLDPGGDPRVGVHRGDLPADWKPSLEKLSTTYADRGLRLQWRGYSEGTLFYRLSSDASALCGAGGRLLHATLKDEVRALFPLLSVQEDAGVAVMGGPG